MYTITNISVDETSYLKFINSFSHDGDFKNVKPIPPNHNGITISLKRTKKFLGFIPVTKKVTAFGYLHKKYDINDYIKIGDDFDCTEYPMLKLK